MNRTALILIAALALPAFAFGKAAYYGKADMVRMAEVIAIVEIAKVEPASVKGKNWTYSETATARVEQTLKGELPKQVTLHGVEDFICAQVQYKPGRQLVFLRRDGELWTGFNWHLGVREIRDGQVEWFADDTTRWEMKSAPLATVVSEIRALLKRQSGPVEAP